MATTFKTFRKNDMVSSRTLLHEAIPLTGTIVSGTYSENNIKNFSHGMFQSVYDYPYLSSSANHILDITVGYSNESKLSSSTNVQNSKKRNLYNQMAQVLMGYDHTGSIQPFDEDGNIIAGGRKINEAVFVNFSRLLVKDEIKKGSFSMVLGVSGSHKAGNPLHYDGGVRSVTYTDNVWRRTVSIEDRNAENDFRVNSPAGEYGILRIYETDIAAHGALLGPTISDLCDTDVSAIANRGTTNSLHGAPCGLIFYQAGIAVISGSVFTENSGTIGGGLGTHTGLLEAAPTMLIHGQTFSQMLTGSEISSSAHAIRHRIQDITFNNTTELNSTIYFCRVNHNNFNYSSNPTYLSASRMRVKNNTSDQPVSYITTVGLYSDNNELMAVAKLSEPLKKTPSNEFTLRVRLDY
tara:strand:+ start:2381 stop:3604 length:1224 start_codon:yes stop_codon:yes gene_type:complete